MGLDLTLPAVLPSHLNAPLCVDEDSSACVRSAGAGADGVGVAGIGLGVFHRGPMGS
jgi:hypothetical protein